MHGAAVLARLVRGGMGMGEMGEGAMALHAKLGKSYHTLASAPVSQHFAADEVDAHHPAGAGIVAGLLADGQEGER
jgi:hypothetical protein